MLSAQRKHAFVQKGIEIERRSDEGKVETSKSQEVEMTTALGAMLSAQRKHAGVGDQAIRAATVRWRRSVVHSCCSPRDEGIQSTMRCPKPPPGGSGPDCYFCVC